MVKTAASSSPWETTDISGLYRNRNSGIYYSRYRVGGKSAPRKWVTLKTTVFTVAKLKHAKKMAEVEEARAAGAPRSAADLKTLGDLSRELLKQLDLTNQTAATKRNYRLHLELLAERWPGGAFDNALPAEVRFATLLELRRNMQTAQWRGHQQRKTKVGYSNAYINQILARLQNILALARARGLCSHDPFAEQTGIQGSIWLPVRARVPTLPSLENMQRIFAEMEIARPNEGEDPAFVKWRQERALDAAEHAQFIAYAGCRLEEANSAKFEDDKGELFHIRGTKTDSADRMVPVFPDLRQLLNRIKARRQAAGLPVTGKILVPATSRGALKAACLRLPDIGIKKLGHHDLRHYFATVALSQGLPVNVVAQWLGQKDKGATLLKVYTHVIPSMSIELGKKLSFSSNPLVRSSAG